jgi:hypothetical protein
LNLVELLLRFLSFCLKFILFFLVFCCATENLWVYSSCIVIVRRIEVGNVEWPFKGKVSCIERSCCLCFCWIRQNVLYVRADLNLRCSNNVLSVSCCISRFKGLREDLVFCSLYRLAVNGQCKIFLGSLYCLNFLSVFML